VSLAASHIETQAHFVMNIFYTVADAVRNWPGFHLEPAKSDTSSVFGLAQFLSSLALLVVVFNVSDFRYRYRLSVRRYDVRKVGILTAGTIAGVLLITEFWFQNSLPIPHFLNNYDNIKIVLAAVFLVLVLDIVTACFLRPVTLRRSNAVQFFQSTNHYIHQGNKDRLQAIAEDLGHTMENIFRLASQATSNKKLSSLPVEQACAHDLLLTVADRRFCNLIVERNPSFATQCFVLAEKYPAAPFTQFARNVGEEFILNTASAFYQEDSGYNSGYFGYAKPITSAVFGSFELVERCASASVSPLDLHRLDLDATQMEGFTRAGLSFFNAYLAHLGKTRAETHSYAFARLLSSLKSCTSGLYKLNDLSAENWNAPEYTRFRSATGFVKNAIKSLTKSGIKARSLRPSEEVYHDVYDALANTIMELIFTAATVDVASFLCWTFNIIPHGTCCFLSKRATHWTCSDLKCAV
jgi:hypothetical protein